MFAPSIFSASAARAEDNWQKMKDCAAQAEKLQKKHESAVGQLMESSSHYSPKYNRCYLQEEYQIGVLTNIGLWDAFEDALLAASNHVQGTKDVCTIYVGSAPAIAPCDMIRDFIDGHMTN